MAEAEAPSRRRRRGGAAAVAAALLLVGGALVLAGVRLAGDETADGRAATSGAEAARDAAPVATHEVTYEVLGEGAADISYRGADGDKADVATRVGLPWRKTVTVPLDAVPIVHVTLGEKGGTASCALTVRGKHVQRATATGAFGRTTCSGGAERGGGPGDGSGGAAVPGD
ncbi:MmpS family transport accessory protein [Streptomyces sp. NPDC003327]